MDNHYHLLVQTPEGNLSKGMRQLNGVYTQASNRRHGRVGHLFQGRFKAILVDREAYLLELARYVVLNPVRARVVRRAIDWPWSSYRASMGKAPAEPFLAVDGLLALFAKTRSVARERYANFVAEGVGGEPPWADVKGQVFLGDDPFVESMRARATKAARDDVQIPKAQRRAPPAALKDIEKRAPDRDTAIAEAHATGAYSYQQIANHFGIHFTTVGRVVRARRQLLLR
jgi:DNA-directed RNA polymerase specialized sigma24 family protein